MNSSSIRFYMIYAIMAYLLVNICAFRVMPMTALRVECSRPQIIRLPSRAVQMNFFEDALRFFSNMNKEASAKHILIKGPDANSKLVILKKELEGADDLSNAFSELASKVSECPSATRGGNLGTFKPGMMVREFDRVVFESEVGKVHGPVETPFGSHLILITRRYEGENEKK